MTNETVAQKALRLLEPIPAEDFLAEKFTDGLGRCCVIGHYMRLTSENPMDFSFYNCRDLYWSDLRLESEKFSPGRNIVKVNNSSPPETRKNNIIAFLEDMIAAGY